jgi:hypothetical protein
MTSIADATVFKVAVFANLAGVCSYQRLDFRLLIQVRRDFNPMME